MSYSLDVSGAVFTDRNRYALGRVGAALFPGVVHDALCAVFRPLQEGSGVVDLDAGGALSALGDRERGLLVNALRRYAEGAGAVRPFVDAAADVIERGPDPEQEPMALKAAPAPKSRSRKSRGTSQGT